MCPKVQDKVQNNETWKCLNLRMEGIEVSAATNQTWRDFHLMNMMSLVTESNHKLICLLFKYTYIIKPHKIMKIIFNKLTKKLLKVIIHLREDVL
jgi:hypothetical protein